MPSVWKRTELTGPMWSVKLFIQLCYEMSHSLTSLSSPPLTTSRASGENRALSTQCQWPRKLASNLRPTQRHTLIDLSSDPVRMKFPSLATSTLRTAPLCAARVLLLPSTVFDHSRTVWSREHETMVLPLGWRATSVTGPLWPMNLKGRDFLLPRFQTITALSSAPDMIYALCESAANLLVSVKRERVDPPRVAAVALLERGVLGRAASFLFHNLNSQILFSHWERGGFEESSPSLASLRSG